VRTSIMIHLLLIFIFVCLLENVNLIYALLRSLVMEPDILW
jgi:hypothetical protein